MTGVTGHVCLLYYLHTRHIKRHNINTGMFLASLSVAELLLLVVYLPLELSKDLLTQEFRGGAVCKIKEYIKMLTALASVINLAAVSLERYCSKQLQWQQSWLADFKKVTENFLIFCLFTSDT